MTALRILLCLVAMVLMPVSHAETAAGFDADLAKQLGADSYGMSRYVLVLLKAGPNRQQDPQTASELQRGHMAAINHLANEGKLVLAGPMLAGGELRGIFILNTAEPDEAQQWLQADPAIQAGRLQAELHPWYGSAALKQVNQLHQQISAKQP
ncbi:YciI family protein [Alkalimonas amylolytica]|uniref:Uncharacterized conserved protein YciI, contains a putative active-site phosphohistidine n=1 Tax=Alkalimonas amylolytica TaxID=152573 RepID=A0A1H4FH40_ALKAM|nr:YciI family protein [Alkalimonas amylolytica]SEA96068.1 Uncharacterized conserved protein YciI, contains a putative active-site phosphohistidine [Alkalimonas amylolytica]